MSGAYISNKLLLIQKGSFLILFVAMSSCAALLSRHQAYYHIGHDKYVISHANFMSCLLLSSVVMLLLIIYFWAWPWVKQMKFYYHASESLEYGYATEVGLSEKCSHVCVCVCVCLSLSLSLSLTHTHTHLVLKIVDYFIHSFQAWNTVYPEAKKLS